MFPLLLAACIDGTTSNSVPDAVELDDCGSVVAVPFDGDDYAGMLRATVSPDDHGVRARVYDDADTLVLEGDGVREVSFTFEQTAALVPGWYRYTLEMTCEPAPAAFELVEERTFRVVPRGVGFVVVIDDSYTMQSHQQAASTALSAFAADPALVQGGFAPRFRVWTTSGVDRGEVEVSGPEDIEALSAMLDVGTDGSDQEAGLGVAADALEAADWLPGSRPVLLVFTDEEDCTHDGSLAGESGDQCYMQPEALVPVDELADRLQLAAPALETFAFLGDRDCDGWPSERWEALVERTGGATFDLCDTELDGPLQQVLERVTR